MRRQNQQMAFIMKPRKTMWATLTGMLAIILASCVGVEDAMLSLQPTTQEAEAVMVAEGVVRRDVSFPSDGLQLRGWLYVPADLESGMQAPAIVTANATSAIKEITLPSYAERFAAAGFVTLVFDFRNWGSSKGEPRNHIVPYEQQQDIRNAISWLAEQPEVDPDRIGGWGVSLGGAHMLHLATFDRRLKAVVATAPGFDFPNTFETLIGREGVQGFLAQLGQDRVDRYRTGSPATHKTLWGSPEEEVLFPVEEAFDFYMNAQATVAPNYENRMTVQSMENLMQYDPDAHIHLASPTAVLIVYAELDAVPVSLAQEVYERAEEPKKLVVLDGKHTDLYDKEPWFTQSSDEAINWFQEYLGEG